MASRYLGRPGVCRCCKQDGLIYTRGLTKPCYWRAFKAGKLADYPRTTRPLADLLADYVLLNGQGHTDRQIAERLGYAAVTSMQRQLQRARRRGVTDVRPVEPPLRVA